MSHPPYHTFRETLAIKYPDCGHALWEPSPGGLYDGVEVGDVGFIRKGCFHRLFNIFLPEDHPSHQNFGVPEHHEPFLLNAPTSKYQGTEGTKDFCSRHVNLSRDCDVYASGPDDDSQVTVSCPGRRGAALSLPVPARREDTIVLGDFGRWMVKHIDHWFAFAENLGLGINHMQDIILVTGCHRAKSWVNMAFSEGSRDAEVSFGIQLPGASSSNVNIRQRRAHGDVVLKLGPNGENLPDNQCIFVRGFRVSRILNIWPRLRGEAEPVSDEGDHEPEPHKRLETIGTSDDYDLDYQDPLHVLLQYISESAPGCDMALVHDDDLACVVGASPDSLQPDAMMEHLRRSEREIRQMPVQCDSFSTSESSAGAVAIARVAMLSRDESWGPSSMLFGASSMDIGITTQDMKWVRNSFHVIAWLCSIATTWSLVRNYEEFFFCSNVYAIRLWSISVALSIASVIFTTLIHWLPPRSPSYIQPSQMLDAAGDPQHTRLFSSRGFVQLILNYDVATPLTLIYLSLISYLAADMVSHFTRYGMKFNPTLFIIALGIIGMMGTGLALVTIVYSTRTNHMLLVRRTLRTLLSITTIIPTPSVIPRRNLRRGGVPSSPISSLPSNRWSQRNRRTTSVV